MEKDPNKFSK